VWTDEESRPTGWLAWSMVHVAAGCCWMDAAAG
jgi:hypothetical protein